MSKFIKNFFKNTSQLVELVPGIIIHPDQLRGIYVEYEKEKGGANERRFKVIVDYVNYEGLQTFIFNTPDGLNHKQTIMTIQALRKYFNISYFQLYDDLPQDLQNAITKTAQIIYPCLKE